MSFRRYIGFSLAAAALMLLLSATVSVIVDPYGVYNIVNIEGFNARKPRLASQNAYAKHFQYGRVMPKTVIVGNSRMEVGLDPASSAWPANTAPVYNFGLGGYGIDAWSRAQSTMADSHKPRLVIAGLDFNEFVLVGKAGTNVYRAPGRLTWRLEQLAKFAETTLSIAAIRHSATTILDQTAAKANLRTALGFIPIATANEGGENSYHHRIFNIAAVAAVTHFGSRSTSQKTSGHWRAVRDVVIDLTKWCHDNDVELLLVNFPIHADVLEIYRVNGLWPAYEDWLRETTEMVADYHQRYPDWRLELWDFGGYSRYATETVPTARDSGSRMTWHLNPGHFTPKLGDQIIKRLFRDPSADIEFGARLEPVNIEDHLDRMRRDHRAYHARQPRDVERIAQAYELVFGVKPPADF